MLGLGLGSRRDAATGREEEAAGLTTKQSFRTARPAREHLVSTFTITAATELAEHLRLLYTERALAAVDGLAADPHYLAELNDEIELARRACVAVAVTEIAVLRAALAGPLLG
jgi:hypothetical protein